MLSLMVSEFGKCKNRNPEDFFPVLAVRGRQVATRPEVERAARRLCSGCPVIAECAALALRVEAEAGASYGIWGGLASWEREALIAAQRADRQVSA